MVNWTSLPAHRRFPFRDRFHCIEYDPGGSARPEQIDNSLNAAQCDLSPSSSLIWLSYQDEVTWKVWRIHSHIFMRSSLYSTIDKRLLLAVVEDVSRFVKNVNQNWSVSLSRAGSDRSSPYRASTICHYSQEHFLSPAQDGDASVGTVKPSRRWPSSAKRSSTRGWHRASHPETGPGVRLALDRCASSSQSRGHDAATGLPRTAIDFEMRNAASPSHLITRARSAGAGERHKPFLKQGDLVRADSSRHEYQFTCRNFFQPLEVCFELFVEPRGGQAALGSSPPGCSTAGLEPP